MAKSRSGLALYTAKNVIANAAMPEIFVAKRDAIVETAFIVMATQAATNAMCVAVTSFGLTNGCNELSPKTALAFNWTLSVRSSISQDKFRITVFVLSRPNHFL